MFVVYNDVCTNLDHIVDFVHLDKGVDGKYDPTFKDKQRKKNPEVKSYTVPRDRCSLAELQEAIKTVATKEMHLTAVADDPATNRQQFLAVTKLFRFKDDVIVQVLTPPDATQPYEVVVRSKSRVGKGDLGANAARIATFNKELDKHLAKHARSSATTAAAATTTAPTTDTTPITPTPTATTTTTTTTTGEAASSAPAATTSVAPHVSSENTDNTPATAAAAAAAAESAGVAH